MFPYRVFFFFNRLIKQGSLNGNDEQFLQTVASTFMQEPIEGMSNMKLNHYLKQKYCSPTKYKN